MSNGNKLKIKKVYELIRVRIFLSLSILFKLQTSSNLKCKKGAIGRNLYLKCRESAGEQK